MTIPAGYRPVLFRAARVLLLSLFLQAALVLLVGTVYVRELSDLPSVLGWAFVLVGVFCSLVWLLSFWDDLLRSLATVAVWELYPDRSIVAVRAPRLVTLRTHWQYCRASTEVQETFLTLLAESDRPLSLELFQVAEAATS